jgi:hypothetical protein
MASCDGPSPTNNTHNGYLFIITHHNKPRYFIIDRYNTSNNMTYKRLHATLKSKTTDNDAKKDVKTHHDRKGAVVCAGTENIYRDDIDHELPLKKRRRTNNHSVTVVTTTVHKFITTVTTVRKVTVNIADTQVSYYKHGRNTTNNEEESPEHLVKTITHRIKHVDQDTDLKITNEHNTEYTTETTSVVSTLSQSGEGTLLDEYTVCCV